MEESLFCQTQRVNLQTRIDEAVVYVLVKIIRHT